MEYLRIRSGFVFVLLLLMIAMACSGRASFQGTVLDPADAAPLFQLQDQFGAPVGLSDLAGKVVVLTFLYTYCPDVCPIVTETLRRTRERLGDDADQVEFVAITVDPQRDSAERAYQYSEEKGMLDRWRFLVGREEELTPIWRAYWLAPVRSVPSHQKDSVGPPTLRHDDSHDAEVAGTELKSGADGIPGPVADGYLVSHMAPVFLIDRQGYRRILFTNLSLDPRPLVHDIRLIMK